MATDQELLDALVDYVNDIKPYHSKLYDFTSELRFSDAFRVSMGDSLSWKFYFQDVWDRESISGEDFSNIYDGPIKFRIPATIIPRFSTTDHVSVQTPLGDDPAPESLTDSNNDGIPDAEQPWSGTAGYASHFPSSEVLQVVAPIVTRSFTIDSAASSGSSINYTYDLSIVVDHDYANLFGFDRAAEDSTVYQVAIGDSNTTPTFPTFTVTGSDHTIFTITGLTRTFTPSVADLQFLPTVVSGNEVAYAQYSERRYPLHAEVRYLKTGRYQVPNHQGTRVYVDGTLQTFGSTYIVTSQRNFIQFTAGNHPGLDSLIDINIMKTDRMFISYVNPYSYGILQSDGTTQSDFYTFEVDSSFDNFFDPGSLQFYDAGLAVFETNPLKAQFKILGIYPTVQSLSYEGTGTGILSNLTLYNAAPSFSGIGNGTLNNVTLDTNAPLETWTISALTPTTFSVNGSISGNEPLAYVGSSYNNGKVAFTIEQGSISFSANSASQAVFTFSTIPQLQTWTITATDPQTFEVIGSLSGDVGSAIVGVPFVGEIEFTILQGTIPFVAGDQFTFFSSYDSGATWKITAIGPWTFSVQMTSPTISQLWYAKFKVPFNNNQISFIIENSWSDFYMTQDPYSYSSADEDYLDLFYFDGPADGTDYCVNLNLETQHGVVTDPEPNVHFPIQYSPIGTLQLVNDLDLDGNIQYLNGAPLQFYQFLANPATASLGSYIELRVEQNAQYNSRAGTVMADSFVVVDLGSPPEYTPAPTPAPTPTSGTPAPTPAPSPSTQTEDVTIPVNEQQA
jgi:hypothetical protein